LAVCVCRFESAQSVSNYDEIGHRVQLQGVRIAPKNRAHRQRQGTQIGLAHQRFGKLQVDK